VLDRCPEHRSRAEGYTGKLHALRKRRIDKIRY